LIFGLGAMPTALKKKREKEKGEKEKGGKE
jgi:hypothetical protein